MTGKTVWSSSNEVNGGNMHLGLKDKMWKNCGFKNVSERWLLDEYHLREGHHNL